MKLFSVIALAVIGAQAQKVRKGTGNKYVILSTTTSQMNTLTVPKSVYEDALKTTLSDPSPIQLEAMNHIEIQLKHMFWLIHDYPSSKQKDIKEAWEKFIKMIVNYGCHCFVGGLTVGGHGPVQDKIDLACREYARCIKCIDVDRAEQKYFDDRDNACFPHQPYFSKLKRDYQSSKKSIACGRGAEDGGRQTKCQIANCKCDVAFAKAVANWFSHYKEENKDIYHMGIEPCVNPQSSMGPPTGCCGEYPTRRSYWADQGKECCGKRHKVQSLFTSDDKYCCDQHSGDVCDRNDL